MFLKKSAVPHKHARHGVFVVYPIRAEGEVWNYFESLVYSNLGGQKQLKKTYGQEVMIVTVKKFSK